MVNPMKLYDEAFLTGCDSGHEWLLPWFLKNFKKYCKKPLVFADFGLSDIGRAVVRENVHAVMDLTNTEEIGWFKKPLSMYKCPAKKTVWIDTDCEVLDNIDGIFDLLEPDMLNMVKRVPDADMKKHFRLKAQGKDEDEQQPMKEETVMSEDNTNPLVKAVSDILSRNSFNSFRDVKPIDEKMSSKEKMAKGLYNQKGVMPAPKGMVDKSPGDQDAGAKAMQKDIMTKKMKDQDKKIPQGASTLHMCAKNVMHEKFGRGECLYGMHAEPDENGHVSWYAVMFEHGTEVVDTVDMAILDESSHGSHKKK